MKKFDGIIFDVDGTLSSTNALIFASFNHISKKYLNRTFTDSELIALFGPTEDVILKEWCGDNYETARDEYYKFYSENHNNMASEYPGMRDILQHLKDKGVLLSIYTGKGKEAASITLKKIECYDFFDMIITGDDVKNHKPSGEGILKFINKYKLDPEKVLMIGDAPSDIKAARAAGVKIASVVWDSYAKEEVLKHDTDYIFHSVAELEAFLK
ncbi:MAG: HAD family hydrolase [Ignavibacteriales bacterium]|nr:MAG: HAD family hydrolase [Ignavibacteriales bacterium]